MFALFHKTQTVNNGRQFQRMLASFLYLCDIYLNVVLKGFMSLCPADEMQLAQQ